MPVVYEGFVLEDSKDGCWEERGEGYGGDPHFWEDWMTGNERRRRSKAIEPRGNWRV